jgi:pyruvate-ferredoxin/flavodoxin oxidoreductase
MKEARFAMHGRANPEQADELLDVAQEDVIERRRFYEQLAGVSRIAPGEVAAGDGHAPAGDVSEED